MWWRKNKLPYSRKSKSLATTTERVFPLSYCELGFDPDQSHVKEGETYKYYSLHHEITEDENDYEKFPINWSEGQDKFFKRYWLRSPCVDSSVNCYYINENGIPSLDDCCIQLNVVPAFAI